MEPLEDRRLFAVRVWDGGAITNDFWMDRQNWVGNVAPVAGDTLRFPDSIRFTDRSLVNNFPSDTLFDNIIMEGEGYLIRGNRIKLEGDFTYAPQSAASPGNSKINIDIDFLGGDHEIAVDSLNGNPEELQFNGRLSDTGTGEILIGGNVKIFFGGDTSNTINGHTLIVDNPGVATVNLQTQLFLDKPDNVRAIFGDLEIGNKAVVRANDSGVVSFERRVGQINPNADVTIRDGGELEIAIETLKDLSVGEGRLSIREKLNAAVEDNSIQGSLTLGGTVTGLGGTFGISRALIDTDPRILLGTQTTFDLGTGSRLFLNVALDGGDLITQGTGDLILIPVLGDNRHDDTIVNGGRLFLQADAITIPGDLILNAGSQLIHRSDSEQIADNATVRVNGGTLRMFDGVEETIQDLDVRNGGKVEISKADTTLIVADDVRMASQSSLLVAEQATAVFQDLFTLLSSSVVVNSSQLRFEDLRMGSATMESIGNDALMLSAGNIVTFASNISSEIKGKLFISRSQTIFNVANGPAVNDLLIRAVLDDGFGFLGDKGSIRKAGTGRLLLTGDNLYQGDTILAGGVLGINGTQANQRVRVFDGTLIGEGDARNIIQIGGILNPGIGAGILDASQSANLSENTRFQVQLNGRNVGSQFDQLRTETLILGSAATAPTLDVKLGFTPNINDSFRIINVLGAGVLPANRVFRDVAGNLLPEGASFQVDGLNFTISYRGGNGNDVVITRNVPPAFENITITPEINEGERVFVTGTITEPDPDNTFFLDVDWGDGTPLQTYTFPPGSPLDVRVSHRYLDDPRNIRDRYPVTLKWRDQFGGTNGATLSTTVHNVAPVDLQLLTDPLPITAGVPFHLQGSFADSVRDSFRIQVQFRAQGPWKTIDLPAGSSQFSLEHTYAQSGRRKITVLLIDDDLGVEQQELFVDVG